ncbi:unnamed protein product, partial [Linum tenue]
MIIVLGSTGPREGFTPANYFSQPPPPSCLTQKEELAVMVVALRNTVSGTTNSACAHELLRFPFNLAASVPVSEQLLSVRLLEAGVQSNGGIGKGE